MQSPHRHACVGGLCGFRSSAEAYQPKAKKPDVTPTCGSVAEMANAEEGGLATSQQIISKASITQVHLNTSRCLKATACSCSDYFLC